MCDTSHLVLLQGKEVGWVFYFQNEALGILAEEKAPAEMWGCTQYQEIIFRQLNSQGWTCC